MTKRRMIHDCIWQSESVATLTLRQRILWIGLITTADDQGRGRAHPGLVRSSIFPFDIVTQDDIVDDLKTIAASGMLILYESDEKLLYQVVNWWEFQTPQWSSPSDYSPPDGWDDHYRCHINKKIHTLNWPYRPNAPLPRSLPRSLARDEEEDQLDVYLASNDNDNDNDNDKNKEENISSACADLQHIIDVYSRLFPEKPQHKATTKSLQTKTTARMKSKEFKEKWEPALERAGKSTWIHREFPGFDLYWFLKNDDNWRKCLNGNYDDRKGNGNGRNNGNGKDSLSQVPPGMDENDWVNIHYIKYNHDADAQDYRAALEAKGVNVNEWLSTIS